MSAVTGEGFNGLFNHLDESRVEFYETYYPEMQKYVKNDFWSY